MNSDSISKATLFLETNIGSKLRATMYALPLFIQWLPGILWEREPESYTSARRGFFLACFYLFLNGLFFFLQGVLEYFIDANHIATGYLFFSLNVLTSIGYMGFSIFSAILAWQSKAPVIWIETYATSLENFLKR